MIQTETKSGSLTDCTKHMTSAEVCDIKDFTENGNCSRCGGCCSVLLPITQTELDLLKKYVKKHGITRQNHETGAEKGITVDAVCPLLQYEGEYTTCLAEEVKPYVCRQYLCNMSEDDINKKTEGMKLEQYRLCHLGEELFPEEYTEEEIDIAKYITEEQLKRDRPS